MDMKFLPWLITILITVTPATAQDVFSSGSGNTSNRTGTQGVVGNPNCPPPTIMVNGRPTTPRNWSCDSSGYWASRAPNIKAPSGAPHPGPAYVPGAANPCQPGGPGGYNWLNNPVGTKLPPGCVRPAAGQPFTITKRDSNYGPLPMGPLVGPPGSYIQKDGKPGDYIVPDQGPPGSYLQPNGQPGSYLESTAKNDPKASNSQTRTSSRGTVARSASTNGKTNNGLGRQDTQAMRPDADDSSYRQDTAAMRAGLTGGQIQKPANAAAAKKTQAQKNAAAEGAIDAQTVRRMSTIMNIAGGGPK